MGSRSSWPRSSVCRKPCVVLCTAGDRILVAGLAVSTYSDSILHERQCLQPSISGASSLCLAMSSHACLCGEMILQMMGEDEPDSESISDVNARTCLR